MSLLIKLYTNEFHFVTYIDIYIYIWIEDIYRGIGTGGAGGIGPPHSKIWGG